MKKLILTSTFICAIACLSFGQNSKNGQGNLIGKATGAANNCIAGEQNVSVCVVDRCPVVGNIVVSFIQEWTPPFCPPGQTCPVPIPPPYPFSYIARVTFDCDGNIFNVNCDREVITGPLPCLEQ